MEFDLRDSINTFRYRALSFAKMAVLAATHGLPNHAAKHLRYAAENLLGYGEHKDILLFEVLDAARDCHDAGIKESRDWIVRLAPALAHVTDFTDGDETRRLPQRLAEVLARMDTQLLLRYYQWLLSEEYYYVADKAFAAYLKEADLSSPFSAATASASVEPDSVAILAKRAAEGDQNSAESLLSIQSYLGSVSLPGDESNSGGGQPSGRASSEDGSPKPSDYPPDRFPDYLTEYRQPRQGFLHHPLRVESWLHYWAENDKSIEAFSALETALEHGLEFNVSDEEFEIARTYLGSDSAFKWLVQAHGRNNGWRKHWGSRTNSLHRWEIVKQRYPKRWVEFLISSMALEDDVTRAPVGKERIQRMIQYCIFMGQHEMAKELAEVVTQFICELISPLTLALPGWVSEND
jgi:hypothetical protein